MCQPPEERSCHLGIAEHAGLVVELGYQSVRNVDPGSASLRGHARAG